MQVHEPPTEAYLSLASRPVTSVLHLVMGLVLIAFLIGVRAPKDAALTPRVSSGWCWFAAAAAAANQHQPDETLGVNAASLGALTPMRKAMSTRPMTRCKTLVTGREARLR